MKPTSKLPNTLYPQGIFYRETGKLAESFKIFHTLESYYRKTKQNEYLMSVLNDQRILLKKILSKINTTDRTKFINNFYLKKVKEMKSLADAKDVNSDYKDLYNIAGMSVYLDSSTYDKNQSIEYLDLALESFLKINLSALSSGRRSAVLSSASRIMLGLGMHRKSLEILEYALDSFLMEKYRYKNNTIIRKIYLLLWESAVYSNLSVSFNRIGHSQKHKKYLEKLLNIDDPLKIIEHRKRSALVYSLN
jgi:tetratricopeptide (TPR) repeat protein